MPSHEKRVHQREDRKICVGNVRSRRLEAADTVSSLMNSRHKAEVRSIVRFGEGHPATASISKLTGSMTVARMWRSSCVCANHGN